uniref:Secreted protein n=1 Tax=Ascaris lumbricoides TaxID=6252 RepID=A0A0M3HW37_ASCLU
MSISDDCSVVVIFVVDVSSRVFTSSGQRAHVSHSLLHEAASSLVVRRIFGATPCARLNRSICERKLLLLEAYSLRSTKACFPPRTTATRLVVCLFRIRCL